MGSERASGSAYLLDLSKPLNFGANVPGLEFNELASFQQTLWAADCDPDGRFAAIGIHTFGS